MRFLTNTVLTGLPLLCMAYSQTLPYNPTTILLPSSLSGNKVIAYVFLLDTESNSYQIASLNISSTIFKSNLSIETLTSSLPFASDNSTAFIPSISTTGEVSVYAGSCSTSSSASLWRFSPDNSSTIGNGTWTRETTTTASDVTTTDMPGANFLASAFSFSTLVDADASETELYIFGGMCPTSTATTSTWQSSASYSNHMLKLSPSSTAYTLDLAESRGPPIAEAGFTTTGLSPTYSNGSGIMTQGRNFVLIGGHTQLAFINMSTVAIWSLPEETWGFETVDPPSSTPKPNTELAVKSTLSSVDSRSGHTSVLTEDGSKIVVLGGWVGDVTQAADPQLAVLNVASGFGGTGDWSWSIPIEQPSSGMYGHGAVMLPGNTMMVLGGYNISSSTSTKRDTNSGTQILFFNMTSMSWISNYTNPTYVATNSNTASSSPSNSNAKKIGLGAGLGVGFAAIIGALILFFWYSRRLKRKRTEEREKAINSLSLGAATFYSPSSEMNQTGSGFPWSNGRWNRNGDNEEGHVHESTSAVGGYENMNTEAYALADGDVPLPPRQIPRKPLKSRNARGLYQPTPSVDYSTNTAHGRANSLGTAGPIHPIYEADEDDHALPPIDTGVGIALGDPSWAPGPSDANRYSDPFKDSPAITYSSSTRRDSHTIMTNETESPAQSREREIQEWVSDWAAADALLHSQAKSHSQAGRLSPTRRAQLIAASNVSSASGEEDSGRTASNLSERSVAASALTVSRSGSSSQSRSRNNSLRGFITNAMNPFASTILSTTVASTTISPVFDVSGRSKNNQPPGSSGSGGSSSFTTAHTSFTVLQAEGEALLPRPDGFGSGENSPRSHPDSSSSPSKSKSPPFAKGQQMGWLGSLRKGFFKGGESGSGNSSPSSQLLSSREPSPVRVGASGSPPRRTVSAGATLWRRKQGRGDWEDSADFDPGRRSNTFTGDTATMGMSSVSGMGHDDDDDWDIERAVQNRLVQVMFTVPKERLRVVNRTEGDDGSEIESLRSKKGSNKSLRMVEPGPSLEPVGEMDAPVTPEGKGKGKSKVLEMVEKMEERSRGDSPER
ncbi:hypothetical protein D0Z07_6104 [Hyphodiscus hymeniophilus]|uniref:Galactose oxidase n=1 Tax=Hyphodiscus hymeniophilus TaxID=353542 RepID=A0A9P6VFM5_9HELO|nr:hypothetical protein D0Z07_6104 [Hyphodiscus hymeniophilus]